MGKIHSLAWNKIKVRIFPRYLSSPTETTDRNITNCTIFGWFSSQRDTSTAASTATYMVQDHKFVRGTQRSSEQLIVYVSFPFSLSPPLFHSSFFAKRPQEFSTVLVVLLIYWGSYNAFAFDAPVTVTNIPHQASVVQEVDTTIDCSQSPIFSWDRRDIARLTINGGHLDFQMYLSEIARFLSNHPRPLSSFDSHARWQPVTQSARSRLSCGQIEDCEQSNSSIHRINLYPVVSAISFPNSYPLDSDVSDG